LFILITGKWKEKGRGHVTAGRQTGHLFNAISPFYEKVKYELSKAHNTFTRKDRRGALQAKNSFLKAHCKINLNTNTTITIFFGNNIVTY